MSDDAQRWKEKYLLSIEQQESSNAVGLHALICCAAGWCVARWRRKVPTVPLINA